MCGPVAVMAVASMATTMYAATSSANAQRAQGNYLKQQADINAGAAQTQAQSAFEAGSTKEIQYSNSLKSLQGRQLATAGANGIVSSTGTPLDLMTQTTKFGADDMANIRNNAALTAYGYTAQSVNYTNQGIMDQFGGENQAQGTILAGGAQAFGTYGQATDWTGKFPGSP